MKNNPKIPKIWSSDLAYLFGLLLGDGSLPYCFTKKDNIKQKRFLIYFICNSKKFLEEVYIPLFEKVFYLKPRIETKIKNRKNPIYNARIESKEVYTFLQRIGYTIGRKARIAKVPDLPKEFEIYLLAGLLDTDGGKKANSFGFTTASLDLAKFCKDVFEKLNIFYHETPWIFKDWKYYQIYVKKNDAYKILEKIPIKNIDKIEFIKSLGYKK